MSELKARLDNDFKEAMKAKDKVRKDTISFVRAAIKQFEVDNREEIDDAGVLAILQKQVKMRKDALKDFAEGGREDLVEAYSNEIEVLKGYLPKQLSEEEIMKVVEEVADAVGVKAGEGKAAMGKLMGQVMGKVKGVADGNTVKDVVNKFLG